MIASKAKSHFKFWAKNSEKLPKNSVAEYPDDLEKQLDSIVVIVFDANQNSSQSRLDISKDALFFP